MNINVGHQLVFSMTMLNWVTRTSCDGFNSYAGRVSLQAVELIENVFPPRVNTQHQLPFRLLPDEMCEIDLMMG